MTTPHRRAFVVPPLRLNDEFDLRQECLAEGPASN
jgi:hypothetical protein